MATFPLLILKLRGNIPLVPLIFAIYGHYSDITGPELRPRLMILWPLTYIEFMTWWLILDFISRGHVWMPKIFLQWRVWLKCMKYHAENSWHLERKIMTSGWCIFKAGKRRTVPWTYSQTRLMDDSHIIVCPNGTDVHGPLLENNEKEGVG